MSLRVRPLFSTFARSRALARFTHALPFVHVRMFSSTPTKRDAQAQDAMSAAVAKARQAALDVSTRVKLEGREEGLRMLMFGKPGSGKGTLSGRLIETYDIAFVSTGDVLRGEIAAKSDVGRKAEKVVAAGGLVPDELMLELVMTELNRHHDKSWIIDGFPRTLEQGKLLDKVLTDEGRPFNMIVHLNVPDSIILDRIRARWVHLPSGRVYNDDFNPPKIAGKDDVTGEPLSKRPDDTPEVFTKRLQSFYKSTAPLLEYFAEEHPSSLHSLTGSSSDELWPKLMDLVDPTGLPRRQPPLNSAASEGVRGQADDLRNASDIDVGDKVAHVKEA